MQRLDKNAAALIVADHQVGLFQVGLFQLVRDIGPEEFRNNIIGHAAIAKVFNLPTVLTSSEETGPNGPLPQEIIDMHPDAPFIKRQGEVNAWDNADFRKAVEATGKKQIIIGGITTDVCVTFLALSLVEAGYTVWTNVDASGTFNERVAQASTARMRSVGVKVVSSFFIFCDLMRDWRDTPGGDVALAYFDSYLPQYGYVIRAHAAAASSSAST